MAAWEREGAVSRCLLASVAELFGILCMLKMGQASKQVAVGPCGKGEGPRVRRGHLDERDEGLQSQLRVDGRLLSCDESGVYYRLYVGIFSHSA